MHYEINLKQCLLSTEDSTHHCPVPKEAAKKNINKTDGRSLSDSEIIFKESF